MQVDSFSDSHRGTGGKRSTEVVDGSVTDEDKSLAKEGHLRLDTLFAAVYETAVLIIAALKIAVLMIELLMIAVLKVAA